MGASCSIHRVAHRLPIHMVSGPEEVDAAFADNIEWQSVSYYSYLNIQESGIISYGTDTSLVEISNDTMSLVEYIDVGDPFVHWVPPDDEFTDANDLVSGYTVVSKSNINHINNINNIVIAKKEGLVKIRYLVTIYR